MTEEDAFEKALKTWSDVDLPRVQKTLDEEAIEIRETQKSLLISKKELASKTKQFKKLDNESKLGEIQPLLKAYQNEIDKLTKKCKYVETAFFNVYREIAEAPDPKPLLEGSIKSVKSQLEVETLRDENAKLKEQLSKYQDYEQVKAKLIESEQKHATSLHVKLSLKEDECKAKITESEKLFKVTEQGYERKIVALNKQISELKALNEIQKNKLKSQRKLLYEDGEEDEDGDQDDTSEKHSHTDEDDGSKSGLKAELQMVTKDLQFTKIKTLELEKRNSDLKKSLTELQSKSSEDATLAKVAALEKSNALLLQNSNNDKRTITKLSDELKKTNETLGNKAKEFADKISSLKASLKQYSDYDSIKNELAILRSLEFDVDLDDKNDDSVNHTLMVRNKKINNDLVEMRNKCASLETQLKQVTDNLKKKESELSQLKSINEKLENDISTVKSGSNDNWEAMSMISGVSRMPPRSIAPSTRFGGRVSPAASIAGFDDSASMVGGNDGGSSNLLPIITQQRDRFRLKSTELEAKVRESSKTISSLRAQNANLQSKIGNLTTEVKFLQSKARGSKPSVSANPYGDQFSSSTYDVLFDDYESFSYITNSATLHYLQKYLGHDNVKKVDKKLNSMEKYFYNFLKIILTNQTTRTLFIIYWFVLHSVILFLFGKYLTSSGGSSSAPIEKVATGGLSGDITSQISNDLTSGGIGNGKIDASKIIAAAGGAAAGSIDKIKVPDTVSRPKIVVD